MAITKDKKRAIVAKLLGAFKEASSVTFVGFSKLTVMDASRMRRELSQAGVRYFVAKKNLIRLALSQQKYEGQIPDLPGEVAVAWTVDDITAPARSIYEHEKKLKGAIALLGGVFEGAFADKEKIITIATIPSLPVLRGMFVRAINNPLQGLVIALDKIREQKA